MSEAKPELLNLTVEIWHPGCWTLESTSNVDAGLLGRGTTLNNGQATGEYEVYGKSPSAVDALVSEIRASPLTDTVTKLSSGSSNGGIVGPTTRSILVEFDPTPSIRQAFTNRGFLHHGPTRHEAGRERRSLIARTDRTTLERTLESIEASYDAEIDIIRVSTAAFNGNEHTRTNQLSPRQREAFLLARETGYYRYPRDTTASELAAELDIAKATLLEHLRKAEEKLLADIDL